ncbi:putative amino-acid permease [Colletotrichum fructicola Nara gc5]|uniref:Putative amino-acid permease n=1 Tax=Colletotrichum fructicola (strain Nara gc5) TaxID=1213859 RepID=A0A7J6JKY8_COLFN|nr:putative amino-acid permease [Colletotrichum fructicola Nara gc5]
MSPNAEKKSNTVTQRISNDEGVICAQASAADNLRRSLSARQVQMIAIGGTIGTGLFLGSGKALATGGPASMLLAYAIVGAIVFVTMLSLGEMAAFIPVAGSFCTMAGSLLLICASQVFIVVGIVVNCGGNSTGHYIGGENWHLPNAPFVGGVGGFATVFVTASFAYGGTESIAITAGETKNPAKNLPKVVKNVFWRILIFYILSILLIGLNVPYNYPGLSAKTVDVSPFTLVFEMTGASVAASVMNAVVMTSVVSAGNHALFAGARLIHALASAGHAPSTFGNLNRQKVPWVAVVVTSLASGLCFASSFIGAGQLWNWLQNLVGVSNQLSWLSIGITSIRFRRALAIQGKTHLLPFSNPTYPVGPWACVILNTFIILIQGWSCFAPRFDPANFVSFYIELPVMLVMIIGWKLYKKTKLVSLSEMDLETDRYTPETDTEKRGWREKLKTSIDWLF